ncbi:MAG TPA: phosphopyruvate hydratase, partial [Steroidobacteraceae bacterium]|nr:phosphopyruvate hydratase [Steroidobacteraceae bacterium]
MKRTAISGVHGRQVLDSRGRPTVEVDVVLEDGSLGRAAVPSGASTGTAEAHELRDADPAVYEGRGVLLAVAHVNEEIATRVRGRDALEQRALDGFLRELDGTPSLRRLGANALLGVSLAACRAAAASTGQPLYARIADLSNTRALTMPLPMVNILSGGLHAGRGMDVQDFLAVPLRASSIEEAIRIVGRVRTAAAEVLARRGLPVLLADEGGLSPGCRTAEEALALVNESVVEARLEPGVDIGIAIDVAATSLQLRDGRYRFAREGLERDASEVIRLVDAWTKEYPVVSIEDALGEEDWKHWQALTRRLGASIQLVGDDLFTTHIDRVSRGVKE